MKITVVQPLYFAGEKPDETIARFLMSELEKAEKDSLILLPEYSNAGGLSHRSAILQAASRAEQMLQKAAEVAKDKQAYVAINVLQHRDGALKNSTYLFGKDGKVAFVYDKIHLPPAEVAMGIQPGDGACVCDLDGIRFGFMTCYDVYYNEQIEYLAEQKPDVILIPVYQRGERTDIIRSEAKLIAFRCNCYVVRSSVSMNDRLHGGCSMIVSPDGQILEDMGDQIGVISAQIDPKWKYLRKAGFGGGMIRNDDFVNDGLRPDIFKQN